MINFFDHMFFNQNDSKSDKVIVTVYSLIYGFWGYDLLFWMDSLEHIIKALMLMAGTSIGLVLNHMVLEYYKDNWAEKFKKLYKKKKKNAKEKEDNSRAA